MMYYFRLRCLAPQRAADDAISSPSSDSNLFEAGRILPGRTTAAKSFIVACYRHAEKMRFKYMSMGRFSSFL